LHLTELRSQTTTKLMSWLEATDCIGLTRARHFTGLAYRDWCEHLVGELQASGALRVRDGLVENCRRSAPSRQRSARRTLSRAAVRR
jgi:hypothetical protein